MGWLPKLLARLVTQLRGLTLSQRMAVLLGGLLAAGSLVWLARWAATPEMVPLLAQDFSADELARLQSGLDLLNQPYQLVGQKVFVRADASRAVILAHLSQQDKLPTDTSLGFDALVKESNPWLSQAEHERRWQVALKTELERVLRNFDGVRSASVFLPITPPRRGFSRGEPPGTASVTLTMHGGQPLPRESALAVARLVCGALRGVPLRNVEVIANGVSALDWDSEADGITALDRQRRAHEQDIRRKILTQLPDPKALVNVQVELELSTQSVENETPNRTAAVSEETTREQTVRSRGGAEPGVRPNVGIVAGGRASDEHTEKETSKTDYQAFSKRERTATPAGGIKQVFAAVSISHTYLRSVFQHANPEADPPGESQIQEVFERERSRLLPQLAKLVKPQDEQHVSVSWYYDTGPAPAEPPRASGLDETFNLARRYGPQSGLALLAVLALGFMLRMARKTDAGESFGLEIGLPREAVEAAQQAAHDAVEATRQSGGGGGPSAPRGSPRHAEGVLDVGPVSIGQAAVTEGVLVAQEVDEKMVQTHKMLEQVSQVVHGDPEGASSLLEQWIRRTDGLEK